MKTVLVLGAGRSSSALISYLIKQASINDWRILVGDISLEIAKERIGSSVVADAVCFNIEDEQSSNETINSADVVISLLPANFHPIVARHCLASGKHLLTASYISDEMKSVHFDALSKDLLFLNECGLDPGIDHMSAMQIIDRVRNKGGKLISFESFTGGLIAPETDPENPWRYKFTWNPRNVVMAGQGTAKFLQNSQLKFIPYQQLFKRTTQVNVPGYGTFEGYANRDSLKYIDTYNLKGIKTMVRGTLRNEGYCSAWDILVQLGCCDDTYLIKEAVTMTHRSFINSFLNFHEQLSVEKKLAHQFNIQTNSPEMIRLQWSGFFDDELIGVQEGTPAQITEHILNKKWKLNPDDKDMIVMWHRFIYERDGVKKEIQASLVVKGEDSVNTAMAKTVGLPLGIAARLLLQEKIKARGVVIPTTKEFYQLILDGLKEFGVEMIEVER